MRAVVVYVKSVGECMSLETKAWSECERRWNRRTRLQLELEIDVCERLREWLLPREVVVEEVVEVGECLLGVLDLLPPFCATTSLRRMVGRWQPRLAATSGAEFSLSLLDSRRWVKVHEYAAFRLRLVWFSRWAAAGYNSV